MDQVAWPTKNDDVAADDGDIVDSNHGHNPAARSYKPGALNA